jgi:ubiquinone/menaquinone biosynthesis C-methylase UbiE
MRLRFWRRSPAAPREERPTTPKRWWLGGGRALATMPYVLPAELEAEEGRLDLQHYLLKLAAGGLYRAPIRQPRTILDVGCGTGLWGREMAEQFPYAEVIGFDVNAEPIERAMERLGPGGKFPANFRFQKANARERFPFEDEHFDFTHARMLSPAIPRDEWPYLVSEMARVTKRGGCVELVDMQQTPYADSAAYHTIAQAIAQLMIARGLYVGVGNDLAWHLQQAGLRRVQQRAFALGKGRLASREQRLLAADVLAIQANMKGILVQTGAFTEPQFDQLAQQAKREVSERGLVMPIIFVFGQRW